VGVRAVSDSPLLAVENLHKHYPVTEGLLRREVGRVRAVDGVSLAVERGETVALVGESGCGKTTAVRTALGIEEPTGGTVRFEGADIAGFDREERARFRRRTALVFQDAAASFDPRMSVGASVAEPLAVNGMADRGRRRHIARNALRRVGLEDADLDRFPHEFSGGQQRRLALARALVCNPDLLVADEPTAGLDVSVQAGVLSLLSDLQAELDLAVVLVSHDMAVVREVADRVAVMYLGEIVERGPTEAVFGDPHHPYTRALLAAIPRPDPDRAGRVRGLEGDVPSSADPPAGCRFHTRCPEVIQPEGFDLDRGAWRSVLGLRDRLARGDTRAVESVRASLADRRDVAPADDSERAVEAALREEFDLPERLADPDAEAALSAALTELAAGEHEAARERLADAFPTPCVAENPELAGEEHPVACHLHDERYATDSGG
jgi:peptide/nickel transport system ATP-binding protein